MGNNWKLECLDTVLVPLGILMLLIYHVRLAFRVWKAPSTTVLGLHHLALQAWVHSTLKGGLANGIFVVQTMRNSIMSSCILATAAITLTTMVGLVLTNDEKSLASGKANPLMLGERGLIIGPPIKLATLIPFSFIATLCYVHSATLYSNASLLLSLLSDPNTSMPLLAYEHFKKSLVSASLFRFIGSRAFCFAIPLFLWLYGPIPMFCTSLIITTLLYFQDSTHHVKLAHLQTSKSSFASSDQLALETSPLMDFGPLPPDSVCLFCPHH